MAKSIFVFLVKMNVLDGMELVYIYIFFSESQTPSYKAFIFCIFEDAISLPL